MAKLISQKTIKFLAINKQVDYLVKFLNYLKYFSKIDCFVTCSFYFQDQTWLRFQSSNFLLNLQKCKMMNQFKNDVNRV